MTNSRQSRPRLLVVSNIEWGRLWQRHQSLATEFANDFDVVYCEMPGMRRVGWRDLSRIFARAKALSNSQESDPDALTGMANIKILRPSIMPPGRGLFAAANRRVVRGFVRAPELAQPFDLAITYTASQAAMELVGQIHSKALVYDCTDNFSAVKGVPEDFEQNENRLLRQADLTIVSSSFLFEKHRRGARKIALLRHGAIIERFLPTRASTPRHTDKPTVLYYGHIHRQHLDFELIEGIAGLRPQWKIVLVGPVVTENHFSPNVRLVGHRRHEDLRLLIGDASALILPYRRNEYTDAVFPSKSYECLASGLPVVSTALPELKKVFGSVFAFADDAEGFVGTIERSIRQDSPSSRERRLEIAKANSWKSRYDELRGLLTTVGKEPER